MATSETGVFFDTKTGKVVNSQPEEGIQLVAPGAEVTDADQSRIDSYQNPDSEPKTVTTTSAKKG